MLLVDVSTADMMVFLKRHNMTVQPFSTLHQGYSGESWCQELQCDTSARVEIEKREAATARVKRRREGKGASASKGLCAIFAILI